MRPSASTKRKVAQALAIAVDVGVLTSNPAARLPIPDDQPRARTYPRVERLRALAAAAGRHEATILLMGSTGLRVGEMCALDVGDVDTQRRRLRVRHSKTRRFREVGLSQAVIGMLSLDRGAAAPLFRAPQGGRCSVHNWRSRVFAPAAEAVGLVLSPHDLRSHRGLAGDRVRGRREGRPADAGARMTLDLYGRLRDERLTDVADLMGKALAGP